eukprot:1416021-Prymnesium_polylepis.1
MSFSMYERWRRTTKPFPLRLHGGGERLVERVFVVVAVEHEQVVDVDADDDKLLARPVRALSSLALLEETRVVVRRLEALRQEPWEARALPSSPRLHHAVIDRLVDVADARLTVGAQAAVAVEVGVRIAGRRQAVDDLAVEKRPLQVRGREVPPAHAQPESRTHGAKHA